MGMRVIDGIRYREEEVELLSPIFSKALRPMKAPADSKAEEPASPVGEEKAPSARRQKTTTRK